MGSGPVTEDIRKHGGGNNVCPRRSRRRRLPQKYSKLLHEGSSVSRWAHESVAVSNAAELFKLVFLSTSTAPEVPNLLAETLRRYSEHDLFAAFNYLREKKIMVSFVPPIIGFDMDVHWVINLNSSNLRKKAISSN